MTAGPGHVEKQRHWCPTCNGWWAGGTHTCVPRWVWKSAEEMRACYFRRGYAQFSKYIQEQTCQALLSMLDSGGSPCHEGLMHWMRYSGPWSFPGVLYRMDWETSANLPVQWLQSYCKPWANPVGSTALGSLAAGRPWLWAAACRMFPALPAALQWKHSLVEAVPWARECRAWLEHSGELGYGFFSLEAARLGKLHEVSIADTQKAA